MLGFGAKELLILLVIVLVLFGPSQLPKFGNAIGMTIREFRKVGKEIEREVGQ